jgi:hypothetical protein
MASRYPYSKLDDGHIRLLRLFPHRDKNAPIRCEIFACPLSSGSEKIDDGLYEALSYVWCSPDNPQLIHIKDRSPYEDERWRYPATFV